jgi:hypothetical protein
VRNDGSFDLTRNQVEAACWVALQVVEVGGAFAIGGALRGELGSDPGAVDGDGGGLS